jgi:hypothetical protein
MRQHVVIHSVRVNGVSAAHAIGLARTPCSQVSQVELIQTGGLNCAAGSRSATKRLIRAILRLVVSQELFALS